MKESPNKENPQEDVKFIIEELLMSIDSDDNVIRLISCVGSTFHARILNAAKYLDIQV